MIKNIGKHFLLITHHKWVVFKLCCKAGIPIRGLVHDNSKYSYTEFWESVKYYNGGYSPISDCKKANGYSKAWLHHFGRNRHHFEYWIDMSTPERFPIIPYKYWVEMVCDTVAASLIYQGKKWTSSHPLEYFKKRKDLDYINDRIASALEEVYTQVKEQGIHKTIKKSNLKRIYQKHVLDFHYTYDVYLAGTCNHSTWRKELISKLDPTICYYDPTTEYWNHDIEEAMKKVKKTSHYILYVITKEMTSPLAIANAINLSNRIPSRLLFCYIPDGFDKDVIASLEEIKLVLEKNRVKIFASLEETATFLNQKK